MQNKEQKFKCADTDGKDEGQRKRGQIWAHLVFEKHTGQQKRY